MKRPLPDSTTHLLFTGLELLRRVASFTCAWCGGKRRVLAYLTAPTSLRAI